MAHQALTSLIEYLSSTDTEKLQELREAGYMETMEGVEMESEDEAVDYWMGVDATALPAWAHMRVIGVDRDVLMVSTTKAATAELIAAEGFKGLTDVSKVATSTAYRGSVEMSADGYCYAYTAEDIASGKIGDIAWYGDTAVILRADALRVRSTFDGEEQMIFVGRDARILTAMTTADAYDYCQAA